MIGEQQPPGVKGASFGEPLSFRLPLRFEMDGRIQLPPQVFSGTKAPSARLVNPARNRPDFHWKPAGGIWTSTYTPDEEQPCGWLEWCRGEDFGGDKWTHAWLLQPTPAMVYVIRNLQDLDDLAKQFPPNLPADIMSMRMTIDWEAFALSYDALWIPEPWSMRLASMWFVSGWDSESTYWCRWCFTSAIRELHVQPHVPPELD